MQIKGFWHKPVEVLKIILITLTDGSTSHAPWWMEVKQ